MLLHARVTAPIRAFLLFMAADRWIQIDAAGVPRALYLTPSRLLQLRELVQLVCVASMPHPNFLLG